MQEAISETPFHNAVFIPSFTYKYLLSAKYCDLSDALVIFTLQ